MSAETASSSVEMIRWTFAVDPSRHGDIEAYLVDQGLEVLVRGEDTMVATWDEPEGDPAEVIEGMWAVAGTHFEVTHEEFHRVNLSVYDADDDEVKAVA